MNRGADGQNNTPDDVELGPIDVTWSVEEFLSMYGDDDKDFVGTLSPSGLFTPALDGPNPKRKFSRNNYGDIWIVATSKTEKDKDGKALSGRSYLASDKLPGRNPANSKPGDDYCSIYDCKKSQRVIIKFNLKEE